jgi:membrane-bound lytic murein transglycosylase B
VLRRANPVRAARTAGRTTSAWARRPSGRLIIPAIIGVLLVGAAGTAGAYLVPAALQADPKPAASQGLPWAAPTAPTAVSGAAAVPSLPAASGLPTGVGAPTLAAGSGVRPQDALAGWAQQTGTRVGIPVVAVEAYAYAELVLARTAPNCHLSWTTIAALGKVESDHGSTGGSVLGADGMVTPPIYGLPLDGKGGRQLIRDTDQGTIDGLATFDRAVGPLQFIPATWRENAIDADNDGRADPNDIDDAALTAASYLCKNGRDMSKPDSWFDAILSYNAVRPYAQQVFAAANDYGQRSRV